MPYCSRLVLPLLLAACSAAAQPVEAPAESGPVTRQTASRESPLLDFEYSWPQAISPEARLVARLSDDLSKSYDEALDNARENKVLMEGNNGPFHQNSFVRIWTLEGRTPRLVSLVSKTDAFTGGAHPNHESSALLWDRSAQAEIGLAELFGSADALEKALRPQYCKLLDAERLKRREGETLEGEFSQCPAFSDLAIVPAGANGNGPFETVRLIADPYVAGPYSEGEYDIAIAVSAALIAALKPEFRSDFEAQPPQ